MNKPMIDSYNGWSIKVNEESHMCANYSFDITDPAGKPQHVTMGGDNAQRALERAKEMIDMEISFSGDD